MALSSFPELVVRTDLFRHGAARLKNDAAIETAVAHRGDNWTRSIWLESSRVRNPKAARSVTSDAALTMHTTQAFFSRRVFRGNFAATFLPSLTRGVLRDDGTQACWPSWNIREVMLLTAVVNIDTVRATIKEVRRVPAAGR